MTHRGLPTSPALAVCAGVLAVLMALGLAAPLRAVAGVTTRDSVLARADVWVGAEVPYSQSRFATVDGSVISTATTAAAAQRMGYRTDCSGFVSMCLGFRTARGYPYSLTTATLDDVLVRIKKNDLRPGDVIVRPKDLLISGTRVSYGHAVIFERWADDARTAYFGIHQSSSAKSAVRARITWGRSGFWNAAGFAPYRYPGIDDSVRPPETP